VTADDVAWAEDVWVAHELDAIVAREARYEDARVAGAATLLTEDLQHGRIFGGVTVTNPFVDRARLAAGPSAT